MFLPAVLKIRTMSDAEAWRKCKCSFLISEALTFILMVSGWESLGTNAKSAASLYAVSISIGKGMLRWPSDPKTNRMAQSLFNFKAFSENRECNHYEPYQREKVERARGNPKHPPRNNKSKQRENRYSDMQGSSIWYDTGRNCWTFESPQIESILYYWKYVQSTEQKEKTALLSMK